MNRNSLHLVARAVRPAPSSCRLVGIQSSVRVPLAAATLIAALSLSGAKTALAQDALGTPFIGRNLFSFHSAQNTRSGGAEQTTTFGALYGHRFGPTESMTRLNLVVRASARPLDGVDSGVLDLAATVGLSRAFETAPKLSIAASTGVGLMAWSDDAARTGRAQLSVPVNAGASYAFKVGGATLAPFAMGTVSRFDLRNAVNDVQVSRDTGWDTFYATGASLRLREVVFSTSRIDGERGMPTRSRWTFSAGVSF